MPEEPVAARRERGEPIKKIQLRDGRTRYRVVVDGGFHSDGRRRQLTKIFNTKKEAAAWLIRTRHEVEQGSYVARTKMSVREYLDAWLDGKEVLHENTREGYRSDLKPVYDRYGHVALQDLTPEMLIALKKEMRTTGGRGGHGRSPRTINLMLTVLNSALETAKDAGLLRINVASRKLVERPKGPDFRGQAWTESQVAAFLDHVKGDRHEAAWRVSLCGLRRSEVLGLTWGAINFEAGTLSVWQSRTARKGTGVGSRSTVVDVPKRPRSVRTIPLPAGVLASLRVFRRRQQEERLRLGQVLGQSDYVVCDELGRPIHPDTYSAWFRRLAEQAGLPVIRLHDARRTAATLLSTLYGVSGDSAASYLGHDQVTFHRTYVLGEKGHEVVKDALSRMQTGTNSGKRL